MSLFILLIHIHDHIWQSDWPGDVRREAAQIVWRVVCERAGVSYEYTAKETGND